MILISDLFVWKYHTKIRPFSMDPFPLLGIERDQMFSLTVVDSQIQHNYVIFSIVKVSWLYFLDLHYVYDYMDHILHVIRGNHTLFSKGAGL